MSKKPYLIIRRSGFYVNVIQNIPQILETWKENNLIRTDPKAKPDKDGNVPQKTIQQAMEDSCVSFTPVLARDVGGAPSYVPALRYKSGIIKEKPVKKKTTKKKK